MVRCMGAIGLGVVVLLLFPLPALAQTRPAEAVPESPVALLDVAKLKPAGLLGDPRFRHAGSLTSIALSADGRRVFTTANDGAARMWDLATGKELRRFDHGEIDYVWSILPLPGEERVVTSGSNHRVTLWDVATGKVIRSMDHKGHVFRLALTAGGKHVLATDAENQIVEWDLDTGNQVRVLAGHTKAVYGAAVSPDGKTLVSCSDDKTVLVWDLPDGKIRHKLGGHGDSAYTVAFSPQGKHCVSVANDGGVKLWDTDAGAETWAVTIPGGGAKVAAFSPDGQTIALAGGDQQLHLLDAGTGKEKLAAKLPGRTHWPVGFSADGKEVLCDVEGTLCRFDAVTGQRRFPAGDAGSHFPLGAFEWVAVSPDGRRLYSAGSDDAVYVWDTQCGALEAVWDTSAQPGHLALAPDGRRLVVGLRERGAAILAVGLRERSAAIFDTATGKVVQELRPNQPGYSALWIWAEGGQSLVRAGNNQMLEVWDAQQGTLRAATTVSWQGFRGDWLTVSPDGQRLATGSDKGRLHLWSVPGRTELATIDTTDQPGNRQLRDAVFLPDGNQLLTLDDERHLRHFRRPAAAATQAASAADLARWVKELGAERFQTREAAVAQLVQAGRAAAEPALAQADLNDAEVTERVRMVRAGFDKARIPGEQVGSALDLGAGGWCPVVHPDGRHWALTSKTGVAGEVVVGEVTPEGPKVLRRLADGHGARALAFSRDGKTLYVGNRDATISVYRVP